jgi:hypothetical protein
LAKKVTLPCEFKYDFAIRGYTSILKAWLYVILEEYGAATMLKLYEKVCKIDDRVKRLTNSLLSIFKLEGNDTETIAKWFEIWFELIGIEYTWLKRSKTIAVAKMTKCPLKTEPKDISEWGLIWCDIKTKTINPKITFQRPQAMCEGDPHCEYVWKIEQ